MFQVFEVLPALAGAALLFLLLLMWMLFARSRRARRSVPARPRTPASVRYFCAHCAGQFKHSQRTLQAWEKGSRRFFCTSCHAEQAKEQSVEGAGSNARRPDDAEPR